jgi:hypothetical protein
VRSTKPLEKAEPMYENIRVLYFALFLSVRYIFIHWFRFLYLSSQLVGLCYFSCGLWLAKRPTLVIASLSSSSYGPETCIKLIYEWVRGGEEEDWRRTLDTPQSSSCIISRFYEYVFSNTYRKLERIIRSCEYHISFNRKRKLLVEESPKCGTKCVSSTNPNSGLLAICELA